MAAHAERIERTLPEILQGIAGNIQEIIRSEIRLAKVETKDEVDRAKNPAVLIGAGGYLSLYAGGFMLLAAMYGLATIMATWLAALTVAVAMTLVAAVLILTGIKQIRRVCAVSPRTAETLKENLQWAKRQMR